MRKIVALIMAVAAIAFAFAGSTAALAVDDSTFNPICSEGGLDENQKIEAGCDDKSKGQEGTKRVVGIVNVAISLSGIIGVVVVVFGGQRYLTSAGDPGRIKQAKDMIMYGVIGVVVAALAWTIVNFVIANIASQ